MFPIILSGKTDATTGRRVPVCYNKYTGNTVYADKAVRIVDWGEIKVPKYDKTKMWALTSKEQEEILGKNWPIEFRK